MSVPVVQSNLGRFPSDWIVKPCSEISDRIMVGIVIRPAQYYVSRGVPALRSANVRAEGISRSDLVFISERSNSLLAKSKLRTGDVVTVRTGYPGTSAVVPADLDGANCIDILITRPSSSVDSRFLAAWINSPLGKYQVLKSQGGLAQKHFNVGDMRNLLVALPSLPEQRAIVSALGDAEQAEASLARLITKKVAIKQGMMQQLLTGRTRLPGFDGKWTTRRIGDFTEVRAGGTPSTEVSRYWGGDVRWMSSGEIHSKRVSEVQGRITEDGLRESAAQLLPAGTVLMALAGQGKTRGTVAISLVALSTNQSIAGILPASEHDPTFLYYDLDTRYEELRGESSGDGGRGGLNLTIIQNLDVFMPRRDEQVAIAAVLADVDDEIDALNRRLAKARDVKQGMAEELLTGRTRLPVRDTA